ncbi:MAG: hypothetical protein RRY97_09475, partial [Oscillibacter sp.]
RLGGIFSVWASPKALEIRPYSCGFLARQAKNLLADPRDGLNQRFLKIQNVFALKYTLYSLSNIFPSVKPFPKIMWAKGQKKHSEQDRCRRSCSQRGVF